MPATPTPPTILTARLRLRPWTPADARLLHVMWTDPGMRRFLWDDEVIDRARADAALAHGLAAAGEPGLGFWMIEPRAPSAAPSVASAPSVADPRAIGFVGLWRREEALSDPELLYGLLPAWWGHGLATEAARAALEYAFRTGRFARIVAATDPPNVASVRVMERLGMTFERRGMLEGRETVFYVVTALPPAEAPPS